LMHARDAELAFRAFLAAEGIDVARADSAVGAGAMIRFYALERADDCDVTRDEDMLLFQWGTYDWGRGENFEIDVVRQVVLPDESDDDAIWQLHLTYRYPVSDRLRALGAGDRWCATPSDMKGFEKYLGALPLNSALAGRVDADVEILFECAG
jgi:hypothetical protein